MYLTGIIIAISTFLIIGFFHPIVIKAEYYTGTRLWWLFLVVGIVCVGIALFIENPVVSSVIGVFGASALWGIGELFSQKKRVQKGWFPMNPKRHSEYAPMDKDETLCPFKSGKSIYAVEEDEDTADMGR